MRLLRRNVALWVMAATVVLVGGFAVSWMIDMRNRADRVTRVFDRGPSAPQPTAEDAAALSLTEEGTPLSIKQRDSAWLPGGAFKLHLDDITARQVMVSVTDKQDKVIMGSKSVTKGDKFTVEGMEIEVVRLKNIIVGSADFGEFIVRKAPAAASAAEAP